MTSKMEIEYFYVKVQAQNRIVIPELQVELLKLKQGDMLRVWVEKVKQ